MNPPLYTVRTYQVHPREANPLLPDTDSTHPARNWRYSAQNMGQAQALTQLAAQVSSQYNRFPMAEDVTTGFHPFKIYRLPDLIRQGPLDIDPVGYNYDTDWRTVRIRGGSIFYDFYADESWGDIIPGGFVEIGSTPFNGENAGSVVELPFSPYANMFNYYDPRWNGGSSIPTGDYICDELAVTWFWLNLDGFDASGRPEYTIRQSTDPSTFQDPDTGRFIWENFPDWNPYVLPIGYVDTFTLPTIGAFSDDPQSESNIPILRQFITSDVTWLHPATVMDFGEWDLENLAWADQGYSAGSMVTRNGNLYTSNVSFNFEDPADDLGQWTKKASGTSGTMVFIGTWSASTTYDNGAVVITGTTPTAKSWVSKQAGNFNNPPASSPSYWQQLGQF